MKFYKMKNVILKSYIGLLSNFIERQNRDYADMISDMEKRVDAHKSALEVEQMKCIKTNKISNNFKL